MRKICLRLQSSIFRLTHSFADIGKPLTLDRDGTSGPAEQDTATTWRAQSTADHELRGRLSYVHGGCEKALLGQTISENFGVMATRGPDSLAVASMHQQVSIEIAFCNIAVVNSIVLIYQVVVCACHRDVRAMQSFMQQWQKLQGAC